MSVVERIEANIRANELIAPRGEVLCLVSGGPDSTCLYFALRELGYEVSSLHVNYGLRGDASAADARFCAEELGAEIVEFDAHGAGEAELRAIRYAQAPERLRATGHTATDQVETILYRLVTSGNTKGIKAKREDGVVRPLLTVWREETEAFCRERRIEYRIDDSPWRPARLDSAEVPGAWARWQFAWTPEPGEHVLRVRATDNNGNTQPDTSDWNELGYLQHSVLSHPVRVEPAPTPQTSP